jgi:tetratricopeptide (TPR) repeat protein
VAAQDFPGGHAGAYLAARQAAMENDYRNAAVYFSKVIARDRDNPALLEQAVLAYVNLGQLSRAVPIARQLRSVGPDSQIGNMVLLADELTRGDYAAALEEMEAGRSVGPLVDVLIRGWTQLAMGDEAAAFETFAEAEEERGLAAFALFHAALARAVAGDFDQADAILSSEDGTSLRMTRRGVVAHAQILSQLGRNDAALALLDESFGANADPRISDLRARLAAGETVPFDLIPSPQAGMAEVFYTVAGALNGEAADAYTLLYARAAQALAPGNADATLLAAGLLDRLERYDLATETYAQVRRDDPAFHAAELGRAEALRRAGRVEEAVAVLEQLAATHGDLPIVHTTLGDLLRQQERFDEASQAYDRAIALFAEDERSQWFVYYARGITHEREDRWEQAEADFRKALELNPGQPSVLNYLGYSFVEMQENLDEALEMIEQAVAAEPENGYIVDSLGWVLYRLGRYDEAVEHMEKAAELMPVDPIVNDHLGDVYWAVGRKVEAEFQWRRALSFDPEPDEAERIRRKLEVGLDQVLEEEGAEPLHMANDAN